jgi:hypothetical protein
MSATTKSWSIRVFHRDRLTFCLPYILILLPVTHLATTSLERMIFWLIPFFIIEIVAPVLFLYAKVV